MRNSITLIDKAKSLCSPPTDYQLAKRLGISHATISRCRRKNGTLDNEAALRLARLLEQDPLEVIAIMETERAKTPEKKAFWENQLPRIVPVVAYLGTIIGVTYVSEGPRLTTLLVRHLIHYAQYLYIRTAKSRLELRLRRLRQTRYALGRSAAKIVLRGEIPEDQITALIPTG